MTGFLSYALSALGLTVLVVWPDRGPSALARERLLRPLLPASVAPALDCYVCCSFWCGLILSPLWWAFYHQAWCWSGCLSSPFVFWLMLDRPPGSDASDSRESDQ